ncbi:MAG: YedE-related selenium metabolism membrane protein [Actinobacteria bacterium]|nr:YedE-related selenium metabolism membrane protein [Actinomycetota bacterium]MCG2817813.1 YedE-related selenium metabolism membrane protein [Actinomycetes bacterium]MBU4217456.1 YedE-related selenium metabolism membrane protein [Actinomycetota bacterium]MBU4359406.1 YedE-related selenium metabolism membrane protein [Actinomycetota bacterium]MBU4392624.1 YedE-related selenium metabolism membrane protein [Actinomycetota bacterium]
MLKRLKGFFATRPGIISVGLGIGILASVLQKAGNPGNMGICVACFERDIAGAVGLHRAAPVQYLRPEIIGFVLGAMIAAFAFKEWRPRVGSAPIIRFMLGFFAMVGALVFLGCPWRALLRLAGGDGNAILGIAGLVVGVAIGVYFIKGGYNLGRSRPTRSSLGSILPVIMFGLLLLLIFKPELSSGVLFFSSEGPGSMHANLFIALGIALAIGFFAQRSRFCTMGAIRDVILVRDWHLLSGVIALVVGAFVMNAIFGQLHWGFAGQPVAHTNQLLNFGGMVLAGLAFALAGGCPGRQLFMSGEGDGDAGIFVIGMIIGAAFAHNFTTAATPWPNNPANWGWGPAAIIVGLAFCVILGFTMRGKTVLATA